MKYLVTEIQSFPGGATATPTYAYDSANYDTQDKAQQAARAKYHQLLAGAAVSQVPMHTVMMYTDEGFFIDSEKFEHEVQPMPEPTPEEVTEPES